MARSVNRAHKTEHNVIVNDDVLVADLRKAKTPGVVRLKLADLTYAHFHVRSDAEGSKLGFANGNDEFVTLGAFTDRNDADALLREVRDEMLRIEKLHKFFSLRTMLTALSILAVLIFAVWFYGKATQQNLPELNEPLAIDDPFQSGAQPGQPPAEPGKPMDADSKLSAPE